MKTGWIIAVLALVAAGGILAWGLKSADKAAQLQAELQQMQAQLAAKDQQIKQQTEEIAKLKQPPPTVSEKLAELGQSSADYVKNAVTKAMASLAESMPKNKDGQPQPQSDAQSPLVQMFSGEKGKELAKYSARMNISMQYGDLFTQLKLPPDVEQKAKDIIENHLASQITSSMEAVQNKRTPEEMQQAKKDMDAKFRAELAGVLNKDELAVFDEYEAALPQKMVAKSIDMQLSMFTDMPQETRNRARDVLVEEYMNVGVGNAGMGVPNPADAQGMVARQQQALNQARDRLAQEFDADQMAQVDRLVTQLNQMLEMSAQFMPGNKPANAAPNAPAAPANK